MGDRAVVRFFETREDQNPLGVYFHWRGYETAANVAKAIDKARLRWADTSYATRIMVGDLIADFNDTETGSGLFVGMADWGAEHSIVEVYQEERQVRVVDAWNGDVVEDFMSFEQYITDSALHSRVDNQHGV